MGDEACVTLLSSLCYNTSLKILNLSDNRISDSSMKVCSEMLGLNSSISALFLAWNLISSKGLEYLCYNLRSNETLKILDLSYNNLSKWFNKKQQKTNEMLNMKPPLISESPDLTLRTTFHQNKMLKLTKYPTCLKQLFE